MLMAGSGVKLLVKKKKKNLACNDFSKRVNIKGNYIQKTDVNYEALWLAFNWLCCWSFRGRGNTSVLTLKVSVCVSLLLCVLPCVLMAGCRVRRCIIHQRALSDCVLVLRWYGSHVNRCAYKGFNHWSLGNRGQETITAAHARDPSEGNVTPALVGGNG